MKNRALILVSAATLFTLVSCGRQFKINSELKPAYTDNVNAAAISAKDETVSAQKKPELSDYQSIASELVEKYYEMVPQFMFRFYNFRDPDDTVTFKLANPRNEGIPEDVVFAHISGKGLDFNSIDDIKEYQRTVYSENFANAWYDKSCITISDEYNIGDYIDETGKELNDMLYFTGYIMYKDRMYVNTAPVMAGWIGHTAPTDPIIITDITDTSFRAYYPSIVGDHLSENNLSCDTVDFVIDPGCNEWRIDSLVSGPYSLYQEKAGIAPGQTAVQETTAAAGDEAGESNDDTDIYDDLGHTKGTAFKAGRVDGNVYISDYAGIKITAPDEAKMLNKDELYTQYAMPTRFMSEEDRKFHFTGLEDACTSYTDPNSDMYCNTIEVFFYNTKFRYPDKPDISAEDFAKLELDSISPELEASDINGPEKVNINGTELIKTNYTCFSRTQINYTKRIDDDFIMVIRSSGLSADDIESRIGTIG